MKDVWLQLTKVEIFFILTTIVSLFINLFQFMIWWRDQNNRFRPLSNSLVALFNDVKAKSLHCYYIQNTLRNPKNPHTDLSTLRWEFISYTQTMIAALQGFQESVVGLLATLNPNDKDGTNVFRSSDYGLTEQERELKKKNFERFQEQWSAPVTTQTASVSQSQKKDSIQ